MARKKAAAHHGGAWKVAYADFVTAMMALFMVLWISAQDQKILIATSQYFQNPFRSPMDATSGVLPFNTEKKTQSQGENEGSEKQDTKKKQIEMTFLNTVAADFYRLLHIDQQLTQKPIDIQVTSDGLRITLFDRATKPLFVGNTAEFSEWGTFVMQNLSWSIERHGFRVTIDGHTKARLDLGRDDYSSWELSADRANAARRSLVRYAVDPSMIERITGYADTRPLPNEDTQSESNQRITLSLAMSAKSREPAKTTVEQAARAAQPQPAS
ncbi:MAG TPA: flagellar motor protein MotB [Opitutus sp.]|nr:flagellar motor protein MotB [Opitutus sp.]